MNKNILVVDDEAIIRESLEMILSYENYNVYTAANAKEALATLKKEEIEVALIDIKMPGIDGIELLEKIKEIYPDIEVIMISGHGDISTAVEVTKKRAYDFLLKPPDQDRILITIRNALKNRELSKERDFFKEKLEQSHQLLGESPSMVQIHNTVRRVAPTEARVLITGENGTGKELVAQAIHNNSKRANGPFIAVNCAAIPESLIESELFGHEKGAFSNAYEKRKGKFELAHGGSIFLDEIGDMSLTAQAKVLRVLEENKVVRVGGSKYIDIDVRVVAATNKKLAEESAEGKFREDLYYRLNVVPIHLPPLRERLSDISILISHFLVHFSKKYSMPVKKISSEALQELQSHSWPGNVRELKNLTERLVILSNTDKIAADEVNIHLSSPAPKIGGIFNTCETFEDFKKESEKMFLMQKLVETNWNVKKTSEMLKMQRSNLYKKMEKYGLTKPDKESENE